MGLVRLVAYIIEIIALVAIFGMSITVAVVMGLLKSDFGGQCPLYPTAVNQLFIKFNDESNCNYIIAIHSVAAFIAVVAGAYKAIELIRQKSLFASDLIPFTFVFVYLLISLLTLVSACITTVGFNKLCQVLLSRDTIGYNECIDYQNEITFLPYDGTNFYDYLVTAESTAWLCFAFWLGLGVMNAILRTCCHQKMKN